ncbi:MAG: hypothetical protein AAFR24_18990 [Cyanobacteria bacterium J06627_3]
MVFSYSPIQEGTIDFDDSQEALFPTEVTLSPGAMALHTTFNV